MDDTSVIVKHDLPSGPSEKKNIEQCVTEEKAVGKKQDIGKKGILYVWDKEKKCHRPQLFEESDTVLPCSQCKNKFSVGTTVMKIPQDVLAVMVYVCEKCKAEIATAEKKIAECKRSVPKKTGLKEVPGISIGSVPDLTMSGPDFVCAVCTEVFPSLQELDSHVKSSHKKARMKSLIKPVNIDLKRHFTIKCDAPGCQQRFKMKSFLSRHKQSHSYVRKRQPKETPKKKTTPMKIYTCEKCGVTYKHHHSFKMHILTHGDPKDLNVTCDLCNRTYRTELHLAEHNRRLHGVKKSGKVEVKICVCKDCGYVCRTQHDLDRHITNIHTERERKFTCDACGKMFYTKSSLSAHTRDIHGEKTLKCKMCNKAFGTKSRLTEHENYCLRKKLYFCATCPAFFHRLDLLKSHTQTHTGEKKGACDVCGKKFRSEKYAKLHMKIHTGEKQFKCDGCGEGFLWAYTLNKHKETCHTTHVDCVV